MMIDIQYLLIWKSLPKSAFPIVFETRLIVVLSASSFVYLLFHGAPRTFFGSLCLLIV